MKNVILLVLAVALGLGTYLYFQSEGSEQLSFELGTDKMPGSSGTDTTSPTNGSSQTGSQDSSLTGLAPKQSYDDEDEEYDGRPAAEIYKSLDEALAAVKKGALDYDDIILEQFVEPGEDCTFCPELYREVIILMKNPEASEDEQAFYSELLAISGRKENIETLVELIRTSPDEDAANIFAESLELTIGGDDIVKYLSEFVNNENELLQEASVAAITNQGSKTAAETLYNHTIEKKDPNGYYDIGIGLGEFIPDEEALPYLQELTLKRDEYSHLAVKSLLNNGYRGLVLVFDALASSNNPEFDVKMLEDAIDHVGYEEETEKFVKGVLEKNPPKHIADFAQDILDGFELDKEADELEEEEEG